MAAQNEARVAIRVDDQSRAGFDSFKRSMSDLEAGFGRLRTVASTAFAVLAGGFGLREIANAGIEAEKSQARLVATLQATGYAAGLTKKQLDDLNDELVNLTEFDDESIRNAQAQLLKFGEIAGSNFERALKAAADFAAFTGTDLPTAAQAIGTALSNQEGGIGRLERQFGKLTKTEEDAIKGLQEVGDVAGAQAAKLAIVESRIGGVAERMNAGLNKATKDLSKSWGEFLEELARTDGVIGGTLNKGLSRTADLLKNLRDELQGTKTELSDFLDKLAKMPGPFGIVGAAGKVALAAGAAGQGSNVATGTIQPSAAEAARMGAAAQTAAAERAAADAKAEAEKKRLKELEELRKKYGAEAVAREKRLTEEGQRAWASYADDVFAQAEEFVTTWNAAGERIELPIAQFREMEQAAKRAEEQGLRGMIEEIDRLQAASDDLVYTWTAAGERVALTKGDWQEIADQAKNGADVARELGLTFSSAFEDAISGGKSFSEILKGIERDLIKLTTRKLVTEPFLDLFGKGIDAASKGGAGGLFDFIGGLFGNAKGNVFAPSGVVPFAQGGVVARPTMFPFASGVGLMGEAGPEAIMPLKRGSDGKLGVAASGGGGVVVNISMSGSADRRSAMQVAAEVGRAVARASRRNG
jgi:lambda family phage tail tape measure protein